MATLRGAVVRRGDFTLGPVDLQIDWADRVAITGANGSGKSTLLAALLGRLPLDEGHAVARPRRAWSARSTRRAGCFLGDEPLLDAFGAAVPDLPPRRGAHAAGEVRPAGRPRAAPGRARCRRASGPGRRWRCCRPAGVNLLVLDEPTNHLDLPAIEQLESALAAYPGTLLLVTHDRRMLEAVHTTRRFAVAAGRVTEEEVDAPEEPGEVSRGLALLVAGAMFMEILDGTVIAPATPHIGASFGVPAVSVNMAITAYVLAVGVLVPISGGSPTATARGGCSPRQSPSSRWPRSAARPR